MLPLLAQRVAKRETGCTFLIVGDTPGQACSCGTVEQSQDELFRVFPSVALRLSQTLRFVGEEARGGRFEFSIRQLSARGPALLINKRSAIELEHLVSKVCDGQIPANVMFVVET